ncbi:hypothetical protein GCM10027275_24760 [Rhabdobacter roseus]|uniref:Uncharacterized protein n=1 Tax=Rhabdobacter roseus TaxID=1655419 RepID=A0A840TJN9_9BACT|nr:hypothetical protein [Rhabdobacter roseus]MBB5284416.1 hypothetical protein [Rhabdobacter roseus]
MAITKGVLSRAKRSKALGSTERVIPDLPNNQLPEMVLDQVLEGTMRDFVKFSTEKYQKSIWQLDVRHEGDLYESFKSRITKGTGKVTGEIRFNFYGRFADMGVGRGITLIERQTGRALTDGRSPGRITRRPKPWFSQVWGRERHRLAEVAARDVARAVQENLAQNLPSGQIPLEF